MIKFGGHFDVPNKLKEIEKLNLDLSNPDVWNKPSNAEELNKRVSTIKDIINPIIKIKSDIETLNQLREFSEDSLDEGLKSEFESLYKETEKNIKEQETLTYLSGKFDNNASIFEIHAGAGGTESCDWAMMLSRMYTKYFNKKAIHMN